MGKQLTFIDEAIIKVQAGKGGDGAKSFRREKYVEHGGPDGAPGGRGGSIYFVADNNENTLLNFKGKSIYKGNDGTKGGGSNMTGAQGEDMYIKVPVGTEFQDEEGNKIADLSFDGQLWLASKGGRGGRGNSSFKTSKNTAPTQYELGEVPEEQTIRLELKVLADVGLLGYPNAGKSTLISTISNAKPKVANYEFTTLVPHLGVVENRGDTFVVTDLPGLIEGASLNRGMGIQFLKHLSRTKIILHLVDAYDIDSIKTKYDNLRFELKNYSEALTNLREIIVLTKSDLIDDEIKEHITKDLLKDHEVLFISSATGEGIQELKDKISVNLKEIKEIEQEELDNMEEDFVYIKHEKDENPEDYTIEYDKDYGVWTIYGESAKYWANRIPLDNNDNILRILKKLQKMGITEELNNRGVSDGDTVIIDGSNFIVEWEE